MSLWLQITVPSTDTEKLDCWLKSAEPAAQLRQPSAACGRRASWRTWPLLQAMPVTVVVYVFPAAARDVAALIAVFGHCLVFRPALTTR